MWKCQTGPGKLVHFERTENVQPDGGTIHTGKVKMYYPRDYQLGKLLKPNILLHPSST